MRARPAAVAAVAVKIGLRTSRNGPQASHQQQPGGQQD